MNDHNEIYMFGSGDYGQLGIGSSPRIQYEPVKVKAFLGRAIECVSLGYWHSAVITRKLQENENKNESEADEKNESVFDVDPVILRPGEVQPHIKPPKSESLAVYIKNEAIFGSDDWFYITHRWYSKDGAFEGLKKSAGKEGKDNDNDDDDGCGIKDKDNNDDDDGWSTDPSSFKVDDDDDDDDDESGTPTSRQSDNADDRIINIE